MAQPRHMADGLRAPNTLVKRASSQYTFDADLGPFPGRQVAIMPRRVVYVLACSLALAACQSAAQHQASLPSAQERQVTVGTVQKEIRIGMNQAEVAAVLGSPNIVSRSDDGTETWIYDKFSTEVAYSQSSGGFAALVIGGALVGDGLVGGGVGPYYGAASGAASQTQRTLTIILNFKEGLLSDFTYHASRF